MRTLLIAIALLFLNINFSYSQRNYKDFQSNWKIGINGGVPVGDVEDDAYLQVGGDIAYLFNVVGLFEAGPVAGFSYFFGNGEPGDVQFIPLGGSFRFGLPQNVFLGADLGYAIGLDEVDGGFYYRPQLGMEFDRLGALLSVIGINTNDFSYLAVTAGLEFRL